MKQNHHSQGSISLLVMMIGTVASIVVGGIVLVTSLQLDAAMRANAFEQALSIAESGIHYYRWHLAHDPNDFTDGTGQPGPYVHEFLDPQGDVLGSYSLEIIPPSNGSTVVTIKSTGIPKERPNAKRTITAKLGVPSFAKYAFLHNSSVFFGAGVEVHGPVMSNGGIRQDGTNDSLVQSSLSTYTCGQETGCSPSRTRPGVWGSGGSADLWKFPVPAVDFSAVTTDYPLMKADAQSVGVYYGPSSRLGYHVVFKADGSADVYEVIRAQNVRGMGTDGRCTNLNQKISQESFLGNYSLSSTHIMFFEDTVWVDGIVNGRVSVVAARLPINSNNVDMWINGTLKYIAKDGQHQLGLISQRNIYFVRDLPDDFEINAALMAQNGSVFRHGFHIPSCGNNGNAIRTQFVLYGSIISGEPSAWNWGTPPGSGFVKRELTHDSYLYLNPPPYFPVNRGEGYEFISWSED